MVLTELYFPTEIHAMVQEYLPKVLKMVKMKGTIVYSNLLMGILSMPKTFG